MSRISATPSNFTEGNYTITNDTINFSDSFYIRKVKHRPIGTDLLLFAIQFENLDAKNHCWYYPDEGARDADYTKLDSITDFGGGGGAVNLEGISTAAHQLAMLTKLQEIVDKKDFESSFSVGIDSDILDVVNYGTVISSTFGNGGGPTPTITQNDSTPNIVQWQPVSISHQIIIPFEYNWQATEISLYFEFETLSMTMDSNRFLFYFQEVGTPSLVRSPISSRVFNLSNANGNKQIIELKFDNRTTAYTDLRVVIQPFLTNTSYPADYKLTALGFLPSNFSYNSLIREQTLLEDNQITGYNYFDLGNQAYNLEGQFLPTSNFPSDQTLKEVLTNILKQVTQTNYERIKAADDYRSIATYLDATVKADRRIETIVHSSASLGLSVTDTLTYAGSAGDYYFKEKIRS